MSLEHSVAAWQASMAAITGLGLDDELGALDTSLPGWRVRDVLAHLVHIEEALAFGESKPAASGASVVARDYTEAGVAALTGVSVAELLERLERAVAARSSQLAVLPSDPSAPADRTPGGVAWDYETLLRNRAIDAWMHEQDIRRAIERPGGLDTLGMQIAARSLSSALPFVVGKRAKIEPGQPVRIVIDGPVSIDRTIVVGDDGRAADTDVEPLATIAMSSETFTRLAGGREALDSFEVRIEGDKSLAARVLAKLAVTP